MKLVFCAVRLEEMCLPVTEEEDEPDEKRNKENGSLEEG